MTTDWKAAHDNLAARNALLRQRHDLPVDRIPAHAALVLLQEENARLRAQHAERGKVDIDTATALFDFLKHGDESHRAWLLSAINAFFEGGPRPADDKPTARDPVVEANRKLLLDRSNVGIEKYGTTLEDAKLAAPALVQHALEETLDLANYLQALLRKLS